MYLFLNERIIDLHSKLPRSTTKAACFGLIGPKHFLLCQKLDQAKECVAFHKRKGMKNHGLKDGFLSRFLSFSRSFQLAANAIDIIFHIPA